MEEPKISFAEFKKRVAFTLKYTKNDVAVKKIKDIMYLADKVDVRLDIEEQNLRKMKAIEELKSLLEEPDCSKCKHHNLGEDKRDITCNDCRWNYYNMYEEQK